MTCSTAYLKSRTERINAFVMRCRILGFQDLHAYMHKSYPAGSRERPVIFLDATQGVHLACWWDDQESGEFCLQPTDAFLGRERFLTGIRAQLEKG